MLVRLMIEGGLGNPDKRIGISFPPPLGPVARDFDDGYQFEGRGRNPCEWRVGSDNEKNCQKYVNGNWRFVYGLEELKGEGP